MAIVYKHRGEITIPVLNIFQSNAIRLEPGALYDSIKLYKIDNDHNVPQGNIEDYEYDIATRVLFIPNYNFENKVMIAYNRKIEGTTIHSDSFTDKHESILNFNWFLILFTNRKENI